MGDMYNQHVVTLTPNAELVLSEGTLSIADLIEGADAEPIDPSHKHQAGITQVYTRRWGTVENEWLHKQVPKKRQRWLSGEANTGPIQDPFKNIH